MTHTKGRLVNVLEDFSLTSSKIDTIHQKIAENGGISDKVNAISDHTRHLEKLPQMANAMKLQAYVNLFFAALIGLFVVVILIKGSTMKINIPGYLEITGGDNK